MKTLSKLTVSICAAMLTACSGGTNIDESVERIKFATGAIQVDIKGHLSGFEEEKEYVIAVEAGQTMKVQQLNIGDNRITLSIFAPNGDNVTDMDAGCNGNKTVSPTVKGDYKIKVFECMKADEWAGHFKLNVNVK